MYCTLALYLWKGRGGRVNKEKSPLKRVDSFQRARDPLPISGRRRGAVLLRAVLVALDGRFTSRRRGELVSRTACMCRLAAHARDFTLALGSHAAEAEAALARADLVRGRGTSGAAAVEAFGADAEAAGRIVLLDQVQIGFLTAACGHHACSRHGCKSDKGFFHLLSPVYFKRPPVLLGCGVLGGMPLTA